MLVLMMMDVGCWDAELLSWEALFTAHFRPDVTVCACVGVRVLHSNREEHGEMSKVRAQIRH